MQTIRVVRVTKIELIGEFDVEITWETEMTPLILRMPLEAFRIAAALFRAFVEA